MISIFFHDAAKLQQCFLAAIQPIQHRHLAKSGIGMIAQTIFDISISQLDLIIAPDRTFQQESMHHRSELVIPQDDLSFQIFRKHDQFLAAALAEMIADGQ